MMKACGRARWGGLSQAPTSMGTHRGQRAAAIPPQPVLRRSRCSSARDEFRVRYPLGKGDSYANWEKNSVMRAVSSEKAHLSVTLPFAK